MTKEKLMRKIQALAFAKTEAELYLDCHPENKQALDYYHKTVSELESATLEYENRYGAICAKGSSQKTWNWIDMPWPWHADFEEADK